MARLTADSKMGFYPTPDRSLHHPQQSSILSKYNRFELVIIRAPFFSILITGRVPECMRVLPYFVVDFS